MSVHKKENLMNGLSRVPFLSPVWQVIFQEGVRENHILFDKTDLRSFEKSSFRKRIPLATKSLSTIEDTMVGLLEMPSLSSMKAKIQSLDAAGRQNLFGVYKHMLSDWKIDLKQSLN